MGPSQNEFYWVCIPPWHFADGKIKDDQQDGYGCQVLSKFYFISLNGDLQKKKSDKEKSNWKIFNIKMPSFNEVVWNAMLCIITSFKILSNNVNIMKKLHLRVEITWNFWQ